MHARRSTTLYLTAILVLAVATRFYRIDAQSFWNDEGNSARIAERSAPLILEGAAGDIHPPLYYLTLHVWRSIFGQTEAALRGLSTAFGVLTVLAVFFLGRRLFEARVGLLGAFFTAVNPFQVYYSQEARMYMMLTAIGAVATYLLVRLLDFWSMRPRIHVPHRRYYLLYIAAMAAGLYTHYAFPFVFAAHGFIVAAWSFYRPGRALAFIGSWATLVVSAGLLFAPWLSTALRQIGGWPAQAASLPAGEALGQTFQFYLLGGTIRPEEAAAALVIAAFFLAMSLWTPDSFDEPEPDWDTTAPRALRFGTPALYLLVPVALIFAFSLFRDAYFKFLLVGSPAFCLLLARGIDNAWQIARDALSMPPELSGPRGSAWGWTAIVAFLLLIVTGATSISLYDLYHDSAYARDDYRGIARLVEESWRPGDAVLLHAANQWEVFTYYFRDRPSVFPIARQRPLDRAAVERELADIAAGHQRLFVLFWAENEPDPTRVVETWLDRRLFKAGDKWYGGVRLATYAVPAKVSDTPDTPLDLRLGDGIQFYGYALLTPTAAPGDIVQVALFWRCKTRIAQRYKVFVHILDANGRIVAQTDREPVGSLAPTTIWQPGDEIVDQYGVWLPDDLPPGRYPIEVGMYALEGDGARLRFFDGSADVGDALILAPIKVSE